MVNHARHEEGPAQPPAADQQLSSAYSHTPPAAATPEALTAHATNDPGKPAETIVSLQELTSSECYRDQNDELQPLFTNITCNIYPGEIWGISSTKKREADTLCQIIGNMTAYYKGRCRVGPIGTMQKKRYLLEHLFYIDTPNMIYPNMTVLEQLMFVTMKSQQYPDCVERQIMFLNLLEKLRLDYIALTLGSKLYDSEKMLIELLIALYSTSDLIIFNAVSCHFSQTEIITLSQISKLVKETGKTLIVATVQPKLIGISCDHVLFIHEGHQQYCGSVDGLYKKADKVVCMIRDANMETMIPKLQAVLPGYVIERSGAETVFIHNPHDFEWDMKAFYKTLAANELTPELIKMNKGRVENSFIELTGKHDI